MTPVVSVVVSTHLDSCRPYLEACLSALMRSEGVEFETIVISSARTAERLGPDSPRPVTYIHDVSLDSCHKKWRHGAAIAHPSAEFFMFLSDDVMLSRYALRECVAAARKTGGIVSPFGQAEHVGRFLMPLPVLPKWGDGEQSDIMPYKMLTLTPDMTLEQVEGWTDEIVNRPVGPNIIALQPWVPFYAPVMPRPVWERLGGLDPELESRHNDEDFCYRAGKLGIPSAFALAAPVLHFGSRTIREIYTPEQQHAATEAFIRKMSKL